MFGKNPLSGASCILLIVGGLNWGLVGLSDLVSAGSNWNVVNLLLGSWPMVEALVYVLVGLAAVYSLIECAKGGHHH